MRLQGTKLISRRYASGVLHAAVLIGVRTAPRATLLTRICRGATSWARVFIIIATPPFEAQ